MGLESLARAPVSIVPLPALPTDRKTAELGGVRASVFKPSEGSPAKDVLVARRPGPVREPRRPMSALADILADLLLPGPLGQAPTRLGARGSVWYQVGAECRPLCSDVAEISEPGWACAPPKASAAPEATRGETWRLADRLWDAAGDRLETPRSCRPCLAVADPVANVVTLSWRWRPDGLPDGGVADLRRLLGSRIEAFLGEIPAVARRLFQRPALHLVLLGDSEAAPPELERVVREILAQTGRYVPDLQVRWQKRPEKLDRDSLQRLLGFHIPWPVWPRSNVRRLSGRQVDALAVGLLRLAEVLERLSSTAADGISNAFEALAELQPIVDQVQGLALPDPANASGPDGALAPPPFREEIFLAARLRARHWQSNPVVMPLAPLTLIAGDNASGKTSFAEALSLAFTGLARPRAPQPLQALQWRDARRPAPTGSRVGDPSLDMIRLGVGFETERPEGFHASELLALFADDADLAAASPGDLSIVTWLGFPGLRASSPSAGPRGLDVAALLARAFGSLAALDWAELDERWSKQTSKRGRAGKIEIPEWLVKALRVALEGELEKLKQEEAIEAADRQTDWIRATDGRQGRVSPCEEEGPGA